VRVHNVRRALAGRTFRTGPAVGAAAAVGVAAGALGAAVALLTRGLLRRLSAADSPRIAAAAARLRGDRVGALIESGHAGRPSAVPRDDIFADFRD
jgi:hypothetical protein